jgi:hypothetical protein
MASSFVAPSPVAVTTAATPAETMEKRHTVAIIKKIPMIFLI